MTNREKTAQAYTDQGELKPLSWGRARIARKAVMDRGEIADDDAASLAAMIYLMEFQELRRIPAAQLIDRANEFADELDASLVISCGQAFGRDMRAMEASEVKAPDEGKQEALAAGRSLSETPPLSPQVCV